jgi:hypothetical protein
MRGIHRAVVVVAGAAVSALVLPAAAAASQVKIGSTFVGAGCCGLGSNYIVQSTATTSPKYVVPAGGTKISSFSVQGNADSTAKVQLKVFRKTATAGTYTVVGQSVAEALTADKLNTFPVSIKVRPGDILGLSNVSHTGREPMFKAGFAAGDVLSAANGSPTVGASFTFPPGNHSRPGFRLNVSAIVQLQPMVTQISPMSGTAGTLVTITGLHFTGATEVEFGSSTHLGTSQTVVSDAEITVKAASGIASGTTVDVRVLTPGGLSAVTSADKFVYSTSTCTASASVTAAGRKPPANATDSLNGAGAAAGHIYWSNAGNGTIDAANLDGCNVTTVVSGQSGPTGVALDPNNIYWADSAGGTIDTVPLAGGSQTTLSSGMNNPFGVAVDSNNVYWANSVGGTIEKVPTGGGAPSLLASGQSSPKGVAVDGTYVYWANAMAGTIERVPTAGGMPTIVASGQNAPTGVAVDSGSVYWANSGAGTIDAAPLGGGSPTTLVSGLTGSLRGVAVDPTRIYWANATAGTIDAAPLGGGTPSTLVSGQNAPTGVAVGP